MCWRGGSDFGGFDAVLGDPRVAGGATLLARAEGRGRVVYCGATQACREPGTPLELLQNILVYAAHRPVKAAANEANGKTWACPAGTWRLFGFVPDRFDGINYLNRDTVRDFIDITHEEYKRRFGREFGATIPGVFFDEIHNSGVPIVWAEDFAEVFAQRKGYDVWRTLVALRVDAGDETPRLRCDYYDVYTTLYEDAWFRQTSEWCASNRLEWTGHTEEGLNAYRNEGDYIRTIRHLQIPATDNEDFRYTWPRVIDPWKPKQIASVAHAYGKPRAGVEAMGGAGWSFTLDAARYGFNMLSVYGVDFFIPHLFHYAQDSPTNVGDWPNSWFFRNPYWKYFGTFADHAARLSYMLRAGRPVVDVAVYYRRSDIWAGYGGGATQRLLVDLVGHGIDTDVLDPDSLARAELKDGALCVADMCYRVLVVPGVRCLRRDALAKIADFARTGKVVVTDRWPDASAEAGIGDPQVARGVEALRRAGVSLTDSAAVPAALGGALPLDFSAVDGAALRYRHVRKEGLDIYWVVNSLRQSGAWSPRFRAVGAPTLWNPEDGRVRPIERFVREGEFTTVPLSLDGWQGIFVVFDPSDGRGALGPVERPPAAAAAAALPVVRALGGPWRFLAVGDRLDESWSDRATSVDLALPTARVCWERPGDDTSAWTSAVYDDRCWRRVKIRDALHPDDGALRYRSRWRGRFVSWYDVKPFHARHGGKNWRCRKRLGLSQGGDGWLAVVADGPFTLRVGRRTLSGDAPGRTVCFDLEGLAAGNLDIEYRARGEAGAVLIEGELAGVSVWSDDTWEVSRDGKAWQPAWEFVGPPEKPYGEPEFPRAMPAPTVVWYRFALPPGATALEPLSVASARAWGDGQPVELVDSAKDGYGGLPGNARELVIRVDGDRGLLEPPRVRCRNAVPLPKLVSWTELGLDWYSGRGLYQTTFSATAEEAADGTPAIELGEVCYGAEVWLNGRCVGTRVWPPYRVNVGGYLREGENRLVVIVANLLANRMRWDIFDDAKTNPVKRKWHDANLLRDAWCLRSGLIGPVRLVRSGAVAGDR